jgi:hypothetical protein
VNKLQFFIHNDSDALRIELAGSLSGANVESVLHAWQKEISTDRSGRWSLIISYVIYPCTSRARRGFPTVILRDDPLCGLGVNWVGQNTWIPNVSEVLFSFT